MRAAIGITTALRRRRDATGAHHAVVRTLLAMMVLLFLLAPATVRCQEIWFGPRTPDYNASAVKDWAMLFHPTPEWNQLAGQIQVFLTGDGFYRITPDDQLKAMAADAASHHIALAMEIGPITGRPGEACAGHEGYISPVVIPQVISKLTQLGIRLQIIRLDGPVWFGHYQGCKLPISEVVPRVADTLRPLLQAFPNLVIGDVVPPQSLAQFPDWQSSYLTFKRGLEAAIGRKLAFLHVDVNWREPDWPTAIATMERLAHGVGMKFGVIYNSDSLAPTDEAWVTDAKGHFDELETRYGLIPDQAVFHSWNAHPTDVFPESSDAAQSYLVAQYLLPRTQLMLRRDAHGVQGRLTRVGGQPVPGARIAIEALGDDPHDPPPLRVISGIVPPLARFAVLGLRVNSECWCAGANDLLFGPLSYQETANGAAHFEYRYPPPLRLAAGVAIAPTVVANQTLLHVKVAPSSDLGFNSPAFPVTPGARFLVRVPLGSLNADGMFGTATVIWMDAQQHGFKRDNIWVGDDAAPIATATTNASGDYAEPLPDNTHWRQRPLLTHYVGAATLRASYAALPP